jgi:large subunit ribosomal protein L10
MSDDKKTSRPPRAYKVAAVGAIKDAVAAVPNVYFTDYRGLSVAQITDLRSRLRENAARLSVVKNRYAKIAFDELGLEGVSEFLDGPTAFAFVEGDVSAASKTLVGFAKGVPLEVKGGYIEGKALSQDEVVTLSQLPSRDDLYTMLLGAVSGPVRNLGYVLVAVLQRLGRVMQAVAEQKSNEAA